MWSVQYSEWITEPEHHGSNASLFLAWIFIKSNTQNAKGKNTLKMIQGDISEYKTQFSLYFSAKNNGSAQSLGEHMLSGEREAHASEMKSPSWSVYKSLMVASFYFYCTQSHQVVREVLLWSCFSLHSTQLQALHATLLISYNTTGPTRMSCFSKRTHYFQKRRKSFTDEDERMRKQGEKRRKSSDLLH